MYSNAVQGQMLSKELKLFSSYFILLYWPTLWSHKLGHFHTRMSPFRPSILCWVRIGWSPFEIGEMCVLELKRHGWQLSHYWLRQIGACSSQPSKGIGGHTANIDTSIWTLATIDLHKLSTWVSLKNGQVDQSKKATWKGPLAKFTPRRFVVWFSQPQIARKVARGFYGRMSHLFTASIYHENKSAKLSRI